MAWVGSVASAVLGAAGLAEPMVGPVSLEALAAMVVMVAMARTGVWAATVATEARVMVVVSIWQAVPLPCSSRPSSTTMR